MHSAAQAHPTWLAGRRTQHRRCYLVMGLSMASLVFWVMSACASESADWTAPGHSPRHSSAGRMLPVEPPVMIVAPVRREGTVNINTAAPEDLTRHLKGVGPVKARAIVAYRQQYGRFRTVSELADVKGIGPKTVERLRPLIRLE
jgi:competence protein ComEA